MPTPSEIDTLVNATLEAADRNILVDLSRSYQSYPLLQAMFRRGVGKSGGNRITWPVGMPTVRQATFSELYGRDEPKQNDALGKAAIDWRFVTAWLAYDVREEELNSGNENVIYDAVMYKRNKTLNDLAELLEEALWALPSGGTGLNGLRYWLVYNATEGFNGGNPSGFSDVAGISRTSNPAWRNYTFQWTAASRADVGSKLEKAMYSCRWSPNILADTAATTNSRPPSYIIFGTYTTYAALLNLARDENTADSRSEFFLYNGNLKFKGVPFVPVPVLDRTASAQEPIVGLDTAVTELVFLGGSELRKTKVEGGPTMHNIRVVFYDLVCNLRVMDPRRCFLGAKSAW